MGVWLAPTARRFVLPRASASKRVDWRSRLPRERLYDKAGCQRDVHFDKDVVRRTDWSGGRAADIVREICQNQIQKR